MVVDTSQERDGRVERARRLREARREQLLEASRRVFARQGYGATSIQDLLEEAEVARGTFYQHFRGKRAVFDSLLEGFVDRLAGGIVRVDVTSRVPAGEQLRSNVERIMDLLWDNADLTRILLREAKGVDADLMERIEDFDDRVLAMIEGSLRTGLDLGIVRPGPVRPRAVFVLGAIKEGVEHALLRGDPALDRESLGRHVLAFVLTGVLTPSAAGLAEAVAA